jgi:hypothetical protein
VAEEMKMRWFLFLSIALAACGSPQAAEEPVRDEAPPQTAGGEQNGSCTRDEEAIEIGGDEQAMGDVGVETSSEGDHAILRVARLSSGVPPTARCTREFYGSETTSDASAQVVQMGGQEIVLVTESARVNPVCDEGEEEEPGRCEGAVTIVWVFDHLLELVGQHVDESGAEPQVQDGVLVVGGTRLTVENGALVPAP